jgi:hypothetical protein
MPDGKFVRCYFELLLGGTDTKIPPKVKSVRFVSAAGQCQEHKVSATMANISVKKDWPEKA